MKKYGIICPHRRPNPYKRIAKATNEHQEVPNKLNREFKQGVLEKVLLTDITYLLYNGKGREVIQITPLVSVILTSYNKPLTIGKAIDSVINQTHQNWELFIMDDNSNIDTVNIIKSYLTDSRIKYFNSHILDKDRYKTTRYATLINEAIPKSCGEYITYLTDDNIFLSQRLETMVNFLQSYQQIDIVYSIQLVKWLDEKTGVQCEGIRRTYANLKNPAGVVDHCSVMHTRRIAEEVFRKYGNYWDDHPDNWNHGDAVFWKRLVEFKPFYPIRKILDISWKGEESFQRLYTHMAKTIPDGTLVKGLSPDIFLIEKQVRRKLHPHTLGELKYDINRVVRIPDPFLFKYHEGAPIDHRVFEDNALFPNQRLITLSENSTFYYIQNNKKHLIPSNKVFHDYKFNIQQAVVVSSNLLDKFPNGTPFEKINDRTHILPEGILFKCNHNFYIYFNHYLHQIEEHVALKLKLPITEPVFLNPVLLTKYKQGKPWE